VNAFFNLWDSESSDDAGDSRTLPERGFRELFVLDFGEAVIDVHRGVNIPADDTGVLEPRV
jgi:hypothetical protein